MRHVLAQSHADLVILDLMLPGEDGLTLARLLRSEQPGVGIVILTGRATRSTASSASRWAPTTTCPSRSIRANCWRA